MVVLIVMIIGLQRVITDSAMLTVSSMLVACLILFILNWHSLRETGIKTICNEGLGNAITSIAAPCAIVGFGTLVQASVAYTALTGWVLNLNLSPYVTAVVATMVISGITGSASGGMRLTLQSLADTLMASGASPSILHRLIAISSCSLDSLPHSSGLFIMMSYNGLTHKEAYGGVFVTTVLVPLITSIICTAGVLILGL